MPPLDAAAAPRRPRRILFFHTAEGARLTGGPRMVHQLVSRLDPERFVPAFVTPGETDLSRALEGDGVDVRTVPLPPGLDVYGKGLARPRPAARGPPFAAWPTTTAASPPCCTTSIRT
ncbi:hypothetical protein K8I85_07605 [bacterium]|nr:hypothetical protein [bacterium]